MTWKTPADFPMPDLTQPGVEYADFMLAWDIRSSLANADLNFLGNPPEGQFASPQAYLEATITEAVGLTQNNYTKKYASPAWNPVAAGFKAAFGAFDFLRQLPVNAGDPNTLSVYDAWAAKTGSLYGGHLPIPDTTGDGVNTATGQGAVSPAGGPSIL
jgi:hypothetical protein